MLGGKREDGQCLLPLKKDRCVPEESQAHKQNVGPRGELPNADGARRVARFEDSYEWKVTKSTSACLFRSLGSSYDELWFPTVIREWCMLYYQCNYAERKDIYWKYRDQWLAGDEEIRTAIWSEIIRYRSKYGGCREERENNRQSNGTRGKAVADYGPEDQTDYPTKADADDDLIETMKMLDVGNDLIKLKRLDVKDVAFKSPAYKTDAERRREEAEAAEIALADPNDDPDWVEMRGKMRGSFSALNLARVSVKPELFNHIMLELCKYWGNAESVEHEIDPLLERNILREIQNFRFRLFNVTVDVEPERLIESPRGPEAERPPEENACDGPSISARPQPPSKNARRTSKASGRGPATNKLAEARAKLNATRMRENECRK